MSQRVFIDSDVIISSLISSTGAAYLLLNSTKLNFFVSDLSVKELEIVAKRLELDRKKLGDLLKKRFKRIELKENVDNLKKKYKVYVLDVNDAHIVAGAKEAKAKFLISYNIKHFGVEKIKQDFNIIITTPANFLQYLRSKKSNRGI